MSHSTSAYNEQYSTSALPEQPGVLVAKKHHLLVRWSHWLNVPILLGLILSGMSTYWASPVYPGWVWIGPQWVWDGNQWVWEEGYWSAG